VRGVPFSLLLPIVNCLILAIFYVFWLTGLVWLMSVGDIYKSKYGPFATVKWSKNNRYMLVYFLFGGL